MNVTKYYFAAILAYTIWGFFSLVLKPLHAYPSSDILFYRVFSCAVLMLLISLLFRRKKMKEITTAFKLLTGQKKRKIILLNVGGSIFLTANWFTFIYVMNHVSVKATSLAYLVCPIITTLLAFFLLHEKLNKLQWLSVLLSILGCLVLSYSNITDMLFSMLIGFTYACYLVSHRNNTGFDTFIVLTFHIILSAIILLPFYYTWSGPVPVAFGFYAHIGIIAVFFTILPLLMNLYALTGINSSTVGMLLNINPIIAFALANVVFHEPVSPTQMAGYSAIFISVIVFNMKNIFRIRRNAVPV